MNQETESNLKHLEEKIEQAINLIARLRQENEDLKERLAEMQSVNNQAVTKIDFILDKIGKML